MKLDGVSHEILEELAELYAVPSDRWQRIVGNNSSTVFDCSLQFHERLFQRSCARSFDKFISSRLYTAIRQQALDQELHAASPIHREGNELVRVGIQSSLVAWAKSCV